MIQYNAYTPLCDLLAASGFGHRKDPCDENTQKRTIYRLSDGSEVGHFDCFEAADWLRDLAEASREIGR